MSSAVESGEVLVVRLLSILLGAGEGSSFHEVESSFRSAFGLEERYPACCAACFLLEVRRFIALTCMALGCLLGKF